MSEATSLPVSVMAFVGTALVARHSLKRTSLSSSRHFPKSGTNARRTNHSNSSADPPALPASLVESYSLTTKQVETLRHQHISQSCSVSYSNSGPLHIHNGSGSRLMDVYGNSYLDTRNNVAHCGHGHPEIVRAVTYQMQQLNTNTRYLHPNASLLAKKLVELFRPASTDWTTSLATAERDSCNSLEVVFFVNSGSEANDLALRLARAYKIHSERQSQQRQTDEPSISKSNDGKSHMIVIDRAYHGHTLATLDVSPYKHDQGDEITRPDCVTMVPCPDVYRGKHAIRKNVSNANDSLEQSSIDDKSNDEEDAAKKYASYVENACSELTSSGKSLTAFIMEGGMSVAGVILPPKSYLRRCVEAVRNAGGVYIADEVQTGFGRLGKCMWAFQYSNDGDRHDASGKSTDTSNDYEIIPDIVTVGKPFGNGMPLAAVITTPKIASAFQSLGVEYFNTFAGSPVCCAAGLAMLNVLATEKLQENAILVGEYLMRLFRDLQSRQKYIGDVRGCGLFLGVELVRDRVTLEPATRETSFVCSVLKEKYRILTSVDGFFDNVIVVKPPMCFSKADALEFVQCFEKALVDDLPLMKDRLEDVGKTPT